MLEAYISGFGSGITALLIVLIARDFGKLAVARSFIGLLVAVIAFLSHSLISEDWSKLTRDIQTMIPALFWLTCRLAFSDRRTIIPKNMILPALYSFTAPAVTDFFITHEQAEGVVRLLGWTLPQLCEFILIFSGLWSILADWRGDLIESRRKLRGIVLGIAGITILSMVTLMNFKLGGGTARLVVSTIALLASAWLLLQGKQGILFGEVSTEHPNGFNRQARKSVDQSRQLIKLQQLMEEGFYRTEQITLKILAVKVGLPEYKCRQLINQELGYRNFNEYINELRVQEACRRLIDEPDTPISNISLDAGYRTLSSFNRAFKDQCAMSPTQYRKNNLTQ